MKNHINFIIILTILIIGFISCPEDGPPSDDGPDINIFRITNNLGNSLNPSMIWNGTDCSIVWQDDKDGNYEIYFTRVDINGNKLLNDIRITNAAEDSTSPSLNWNGNCHALSWKDGRDMLGYEKVYFTRFDINGNKLSSDNPVSEWYGGYSKLVWTGNGYGLSYESGPVETSFDRLDIYGVKLGTTTEENYNPGSLVWNGFNYGLTWKKEESGTMNSYFANINSDASVVNIYPLFVNSTNDYDVNIIWTGTKYGMFWRNQVIDQSINLFFNYLDNDGNILGANKLISSDVFAFYGVSTIWTGDHYAISFCRCNHSFELDFDFPYICFARVSEEGNLIGTEITVNGNNNLFSSESQVMVWTGSKYLIVWSDNRDDNWEIYYATIEY